MNFLYQDIIAKIEANATLFTDNGLAPIAHFDRYKGQYINPEMHNPYGFPALFIQFNTVWTDTGNLNQEGVCTIRLHLELQNQPSESAHGSPDQTTALQDFDYMTVLNALIHGMSGDNYSRIVRKTTDEDDNPQETNVTIIGYETTVKDNSAERYKDYIEVPLDDVATTHVAHQSNTPPEAGNKYTV